MIYFCRVHCLSLTPKQHALPASTPIHPYNLENAEHPALTYPMMAGSDPSGLVSSRVIEIGASSSSMIDLHFPDARSMLSPAVTSEMSPDITSVPWGAGSLLDC